MWKALISGVASKPPVIINHLLMVSNGIKSYAWRPALELFAIQLFTGPSNIIMETPQKYVLLFVVMAAEGNCGHPLACRPLGAGLILVRRGRFFRERLWPHGTTHHTWSCYTGSLTGRHKSPKHVLSVEFLFGWECKFIYICVRKRGMEGIPTWPQYLTKPKQSSLFSTQMFFWLFWCWHADWCEQVIFMCCLMSSGSLLPHFSLSHQSTVFF